MTHNPISPIIPPSKSEFLSLSGRGEITDRSKYIGKVYGLFYVSIGAKKGATIPILQHGHGEGAHEITASVIKAAEYINPLPHVLMLTAIVVAVATLGVALALAIKVYNRYETLEEDEILAQIREK